MQVVLTTQHKFYVMESLLSQQRERLGADLYNFLTFKLGGRYTLLRQKTVLGFVFSELKHRSILKFWCLCHNVLYLLISKNFFCREATHRGNLLERLDVEILLIAKNDIAIRLMGNVLLFEVHDILQRD